MKSKIDFVIAWVDGSDPVWQECREKNTGIKASVDACRYRDWNLLKFWFRGVERFAPWVNKVHFVTFGHLPSWLNTSHPKLNIVNHQEYIPSKYLPTFNSHVIELNFHRINGLENKFVYFNDDIFLINKVEPEDFFLQSKARDNISFDALKFKEQSIAFIDCNNISIINDNYDKYKFLVNNWYELLNPKIGFKKVVKNILLAPFPYFTGFYNNHLPSSFFKDTYEDIWLKYYDVLNDTCLCKVRERSNINQWLIKDLQFVNYRIKNREENFGKLFNISSINLHETCEYIKNQQGKVICVNDNELTDDINRLEIELTDAFNNILNKKSMFEI